MLRFTGSADGLVQYRGDYQAYYHRCQRPWARS